MTENCYVDYFVANGRAGGAGGAGGNGATIGAGGTGGNGGGGGDSGSVVMHHDPTGTVTDFETTFKVTPSVRGAEGANGSAGTEKTDTTLNPANLPYNTVTFTGANSNGTQNYYLKNGDTITVPDYTPTDANKVFKGWKVTTPAAALPSAFGETASQLLSTDTHVYQPNETIPTTGIYGNVVLTAVLEEAGYNVDTTRCTVSVDTQTDVTTATDVHAGETVSIKADIAAPGSSVKAITAYKAGSTTDTVPLNALPDLSAGTASFTMPDHDVQVVVEYTPDNYVITVNNGTVQGAVEQADGRMTATYGYELTLTADAKVGKKFKDWTLEPADVDVTGDPTKDATIKVKMPAGDLTATANYEDIVYTVSVKPDPDDHNNGHCTVTPAAGGIMGATITLQAEDRTADGWEFESFTVTADDLNNAEQGVILNTGTRTGTFTMPASNVTVKVNYRRSGYAVTVRNGKLNVDNGSWVNVATAKVGTLVALQADAPETGAEFTGWEFTVNGVTVTNVEIQDNKTAADTEIVVVMPNGSLVATATYSNSLFSVFIGEDEVTQAQKNAVVTIEAPTKAGYRFAGWQTDDLPDLTDGQKQNPSLTFAMPAKDVHLTVSYEPLDPDAYEITILDEDGQDSGYAQVDGVTVTGAVESKTVEIIAAAKLDKVFDYWEVTACEDASVDLENLLADPGKERTSFTMPAGAVTFTAHYKPIELVNPVGPTQSGDTITKGEAVGAAVAAVGVGIAVWQGSELAMRIYRNKVIQIDYWPGNRIALAQLIWSRAGSPEPESDVSFADITEALDTLNDTNINAQKAARWCVEQGLLDAKTAEDGTETFEPMKHVTHLRVCLTWQNARKMGLFEVPVEAAEEAPAEPEA